MIVFTETGQTFNFIIILIVIILNNMQHSRTGLSANIKNFLYRLFFLFENKN